MPGHFVDRANGTLHAENCPLVKDGFEQLGNFDEPSEALAAASENRSVQPCLECMGYADLVMATATVGIRKPALGHEQRLAESS